MSGNVVEIVTAPSLVAFIVAAKVHAFHPDDIETLVRETYPMVPEAEIGDAIVGAIERMREDAVALSWVATALERHARARARPVA
jgi:hypothetical protein